LAAIRLNKINIEDTLIGLSILVSSITFFKEPFEGYFHYLIFLLYLPIFISRYGFQALPFKFILIPVACSLLNLFLDNCTFFVFFKVFVGMLLSVTFYHYVLIHYEFNFKKLFGIYLKGIVICCYIGLIEVVSFRFRFSPGYNYQWLLNKWGLVPGSFAGLRMNSIFSEPSQFALMLLPAVFIAIYSILFRNFSIISLWKCILILSCLILSTSSTGYLGIFFSVFLIALNFRRIFDFFLLGLASIFGFYLLYVYVPDFKSRVDASVNLWTKDEYTLDDINSSSFVQFNNSHVAWKNFLAHPLFGTGLGSYALAYEKYSLTKEDDFLIKKGFDFNSLDANSLFFRTMAEMGLVGVFFWIFLISKFFVRKDPEEPHDITWLYSGAALTIIFGYLLRQGNYFLNGFPFFVLFYCFLAIKHNEGHVVIETEEGEEEEEEEEKIVRRGIEKR
jgi:hypothetical protein